MEKLSEKNKYRQKEVKDEDQLKGQLCIDPATGIMSEEDHEDLEG